MYMAKIVRPVMKINYSEIFQNKIYSFSISVAYANKEIDVSRTHCQTKC